MSTENSIPIYLKLYARKGKPTDQLIKDVDELSKECTIEADVTLSQVLNSDKNSSLQMLVYEVKTKPSRQRHSNSVGTFLDQVFSQFADKHPAYIEPLTVSESEA